MAVKLVSRLAAFSRKYTQQVAPLGRIQLVERPEDDEDNEDKSPEVISVHEGKSGFAGFTATFGDFRNGGLGDFELGIG